MRKIIERVKKGEIQKIIIIKLDRVSRRIVDFAMLLKTLTEYDCALISLTENFDFSTTWGKLIASVLIIFAEYELDQATDRTRVALVEIAEQGKYPYGGNVPVGFKRTEDNFLVIDDKKADTIRDLYRMIAEHRSCNSIALEYDREKKLDMSWTADKIAKIIRNTIYKGNFYYERINKFYEEFCTALVSDELWDMANAHIDKVSRVPTHTYLFYNIVFCNRCKRLTVQETTSKKNKIYYYYKCTNCDNRINENRIVNQIYMILMMIYENEDKNPYYQNEKSKIISKISRLKQMIENYYRMVIDEETTLQEYRDFKIKTENTIVDLEAKYKELSTKDERIAKDPFSALDKDIKAELISRNIKKIEVDLHTKKVVSIIQNGGIKK